MQHIYAPAPYLPIRLKVYSQPKLSFAHYSPMRLKLRKRRVWPRITHVMEKNLIPFRHVIVPAG